MAYIVQQAFFEQNENRSALFAVKAVSGSAPVKLSEEKSLSQVRWTPDGKSITYLAAQNGPPQIWRVSLTGGAPEQITNHVTGVGQYEWSPSGEKLAFFASEMAGNDERALAETQGVLFDYSLSAFGMMN